jgi:hypothetical protein
MHTKLFVGRTIKNRQNYLQQRMEDLNERNTEAKTTIEQIIQREEGRNDFSVIRSALKPKRSKGIKQLDLMKKIVIFG